MIKPVGSILIAEYALGIKTLRLGREPDEDDRPFQYLFTRDEIMILLSSVSDGWKEPSQMIMCLSKKRIAWTENDLVKSA